VLFCCRFAGFPCIARGNFVAEPCHRQADTSLFKQARRSLLNKSLLLRQQIKHSEKSAFLLPFCVISVPCTGQLCCRTLSPPAARSVPKTSFFHSAVIQIPASPPQTTRSK